ncbi:TPA: outer membrane lipoprotein-sorting protein [Candidatus Poribacteria bacterium]|nr:outer membrane lipoprotein-sorting protein [Candidatus Poribacteria bacterium]
MRSLRIALCLGLALTISLPSYALTGEEILKRVDEVSTAPKDIHMLITTILIDSKGNRKERKTETFQKGGEKRLIRILAPADRRGIGFLALPNDVQYVYMPAFRKVRRIASHVKNTKFAGSDFTYDDLSTFRFSKDYNAKLLKTTDKFYILELTPKPGVNKEYSKLRMWVRRDNFVSTKIEYYDKKGELKKVLERRKITKIGNYWTAKEMEMRDVKENHSTKMIQDKVEFDTGLSDRIFSPRYLRRTR